MSKYRNPALTVDTLIIDNNKIVLIKRLNNPFKNHWALPGGFVEYGEKVEDAAVREAKEDMEATLPKCKEVSLDFCNKRNIFVRGIQSIMRLIAPLL